MARLHLALAALWAALAVPALLWWHDSVLFVLLASLYANAVGHLAAFQAARAEAAERELARKVDGGSR